MRSYLALAGKLAAAYLLFGILWIFLSDGLLSFLFDDPGQISLLQTGKGLLFVVLSASAVGALGLFLGERLERGEALLLQRTRQLAEVEEQGNLGSWHYDGQFHWSAQAAHLLGCAPDCSLEELLILICPADRGGLQRALIACLDEQQEGFNLNLQLNRAPSPHTSQWLQICAQRSAADTQLHGTLRDVTSQRLDQEALRESEQRFRRLLEQTPRIAVQAYDRERRVIFWNSSSERLYGYSLTEALGRRLEELIIPEPMQEKVVNDIQHWMNGGQALPPSELALRRKDGSLVWVYSSHLMLRNRQNQPEMFCLDIDLSELKQTSMDLHNSELRFRQLSNSSARPFSSAMPSCTCASSTRPGSVCTNAARTTASVSLSGSSSTRKMPPWYVNAPTPSSTVRNSTGAANCDCAATTSNSTGRVWR